MPAASVGCFPASCSADVLNRSWRRLGQLRWQGFGVKPEDLSEFQTPPAR